MITVTQYTHFPNNTELGKGNTHECYILVPNRYDLSNIFPTGVEVSVVDVNTQKTYLLKSALGREFRINQLGQFYRDHDVHMGDEIVFTHIKGENDEKVYISVHKYNRVIINLGKNDAEIINVERLKRFFQESQNKYVIPISLEDNDNVVLSINFKEARAKRTDSPILTDYYTVQCDKFNLNSGTYFLTLADTNTLHIAEKTSLKVFPFDENIVGFQNESSNTSRGVCISQQDTLVFQFDDPTKFVWECIKHFNRQECLKELFESKWFARSGFYNNYYTINGCFVAKEDTEGGEFENIEIFNNVLINNNFEVRTQEQVDGFIEAVNILFSGRYKILKEGDFENATYKLIKTTPADINLKYLPYLAALRTKPFMLLAGISGTGKSRIARQIAKACWKPSDADYGKNNPSNFCLVQVKPNWHDSTELLGYVSRIGETPRYVTGDFLPFIAKAWENKDVPHILCLDEMNLAPVEQYFAEYLSVIESRKLNEDGTITTDPILKKNQEDWYRLLTAELTNDDELRAQFLDQGITLPPNLFVIGTVNMDETTFSFSRKVLDRAMTIEMNEVDLDGGLTKEEQNELGEIGKSIIGLAVEGKDVYEDHKDYCDQVIDYLKLVNEELENTPFKIAYRTRNEFLLYAVNRKAFDNESNLETALDEMISMKILPRIEGDSERVKNPLEALRKLMQERGWDENESISLKKIKEMITKLQQSGYTSYWT